MTNKKADGTVIDSYTYTYDGAHNQTSKVDGKGTTSYTYDVLNRLLTITEPNGKSTTYSYDTAGNRLTESVTLNSSTDTTTYTYNEQNRLINTVTVNSDGSTEINSFDYDNNGNLLCTQKETYINDNSQNEEYSISSIGDDNTGNEVTIYQYDDFNQMINTVTGNNSVACTYNGDGLRVSKSVNDVVTNYLYEYDKVVLEVDDKGRQIARNVYGTNLISRQVDGQKLYYMYNGHADVTALLDSTGTIVATYYYDAFGNITEQTGNVNNNVTYAGYEYDKETGLYYLMSRMYDPTTARFLQEDTYFGDKNDPLSLNLYTYCHNEPLMYWDYDGRKEAGAVIKKGFSGNDVKIIHKVLIDRGNYYGKDTKGTMTWEQITPSGFGIYGSKTTAAIKGFQEWYNETYNANLATDGRVGDKTWEAMRLPDEGSDLYNWMLNDWNSLDAGYNSYANSPNSSYALAWAKGQYSGTKIGNEVYESPGSNTLSAQKTQVLTNYSNNFLFKLASDSNISLEENRKITVDGVSLGGVNTKATLEVEVSTPSDETGPFQITLSNGQIELSSKIQIPFTNIKQKTSTVLDWSDSPEAKSTIGIELKNYIVTSSRSLGIKSAKQTLGISNNPKAGEPKVTLEIEGEIDNRTTLIVGGFVVTVVATDGTGAAPYIGAVKTVLAR